MKYIEKLLNGAEVQWMPLGEVFETRNGYTPSKANNDFWTNGDIPWFRMEDIRESGRLLNDSIQHITPQAIKGKGLFRANSIIMATTATIGEHALLLVDALANQQFTNFQIRKSLSERISPMFAFYYFFVLGEWCKSNVNTSSFPSVDMARLMKQLFPIPPLAVQEEIVRILDKFTTLEAELDCRKRQYEYYRNQLLSLDVINRERKLDYVESVPLGKIGEIRMCKRILKEQTKDSGDIPFYKIGTFGKTPNSYISKELFKEYKLKYNYPKIGEVLISASGTIGKAVIFDGEDAYFQDSNIVWIENDESMFLNKYLFYCYQIAKWKIAEGGTIQRLYNDNLKKTMIPVPYFGDNKKSLAEQQRIVSILDKFETLTTSISEGLPKEIELRRKQYEYYRNQLLSFA
ncbi:restriction endonuclease subunit S [Hoylesella shahii]|uniref:restriction endonuclease subunit S n=1 Tax=Hoylesella shahii TaxID=228603 RepID=UPI0028D6CF4E|nr:restriction endonuclease subunit S [Hoylesella shahii]